MPQSFYQVYRQDRWEYPPEVIREALAIFDNTLEISSLGPLPDNLPPDALGTGIRRMREKVKDYPDIQLELQKTGNSFQVRFVKVASQDEAHEAQDKLTNIDFRILYSCSKQLLSEAGYSTRTGNYKKPFRNIRLSSSLK